MIWHIVVNHLLVSHRVDDVLKILFINLIIFQCNVLFLATFDLLLSQLLLEKELLLLWMRLLLLKALLLLELLLKNQLLLHGRINLLSNTWITLTCLIRCSWRNLLEVLILLLLLHHLLLLLRCHVLHLLFSLLLLHLLLSHLGLLCWLSSHLLLLLILAFLLAWLSCVFFIVCTLLGASRFWIFLLAFFHGIRLCKCLWGLDLNLLRGWLLLRNIDSNSYFSIN